MEEILKRGPGRPPKEEVRSDAQDDSAAARRKRHYGDIYNSLGQKLAYAPREGYHRHWFNDTAGRIQEFYQKGYEHVKDNEGKNVSRVVGTAESGGPLHAFLMEIPEEWWREDVAKAEAESNARMEAIKRPGPPVGTEARDSDKFYAGKEGSSIRRDR